MFDYQRFFSPPFKASIKEILGDLFISGIGSIPSPELLEQEAPEFALTLNQWGGSEVMELSSKNFKSKLVEGRTGENRI